ncbi:MAG: response regulator [Rhodoferax sp.]|nr:response regulator [Rhodoferax sp.]
MERRGKLSRQLLTRVLLVCFVLASLAALYNGWSSYRTERVRQQDQLQAVLAAYRDTLSKALWELDQSSLELQLTGLKHYPAILFAAVTGKGGMQANYSKRDAVQPHTDAPLRYELRADEGKRLMGSLDIRLDEQALRAEVLGEALRGSLLVSMELALLALVIYWLVQRDISSPIRELSEHVGALSIKTLGQPAPRPTTLQPNELHRLAEGITRLQAELQQQLAHREAIARELEQHRDQLKAQAERQEVQLDAVLENMADGAGVLDGAGVILYANPAWVHIMGVATGEELQQLTPAQWLQASWQELQTQLDATDTAGGAMVHQLILLRPHGSEVPVEASFSVIERHADGLPKRIQTMVRDITLRRETERALVAAREAAFQASKAKSDFLANMSHEIRTPMNGVMGLTQLLLDTPLNDRQRDYLNKIISSSRALLNILNDILDYSKIEAGRLDLEQQDMELDAILGNVANLFATHAEQKGIELFLEVDRKIPALRGDALRLGQVLNNLVGNALKFTPKGEIHIKVELLERSDDAVQLAFSVRDTGIGLSSEQAQKLFQPFTQADGSITRRFGGTGLGLSISKRIVELMQGEIGVESVLGQGTTFRFTARLALQPVQADATVLGLPPMRVLVVDDMATSRLILRHILQSWHFDITEADSGEQALAALQEAQSVGKPFDLLLLDWQMPGIDGLEVAARVQRQALAHAPTIIMATAFSREKLLSTAQDIHLDAVLTKPVTASDLSDTLSSLHGQQRAPKAASKAPIHSIRQKTGAIRGAHVLLAEDNAVNQQVAQGFLENAGLKVDIAQNGREALERIATSSYDLVLMDLHMPEMDGFEATRAIRAQGLTTLPIVAMTAAAMKQDVDASLAAGMNDHVAKPIDPDALCAALLRWISPGRRSDVEENDTTHAVDEDEGGVALVLPGFDLEGLRSRTGADRAGVLQLLGLFANEVRAAPEDLARLLRDGDHATARRLAHSVRGAAGNLGALELQAVAQRLEAELSQPGIDVEELASSQQAFVASALQTIAVLDGLRTRQQPTAEAPSDPLDLTILAQHINALMVQLAASEAIQDAQLHDLRTALAGHVPGGLCETLFNHIDCFDYAAAMDALSAIATSLKIQLIP